MSELFESLEEDKKAAEEAGITIKEQDNGQESTEESGEHKYDTRASRERISGRRLRRNSGASSLNESEASQEDGGASRGSRGDSQGSSSGTSEDAQASQQPSGTSQSSESVLEESEPKDDSSWAKYRRERRELETKARKLEQELADARKTYSEPAAPKIAEKPSDAAKSSPEPDKEKDLAGWLVWNAEEQRNWRASEQERFQKETENRKVETLIRSAQQEIDSIQDAYRKTNPDFDNAIAHARAEYGKAVKVLNPTMSESAIKQAIDQEIFNMALKCNRDGTNLGEVLYDTAIERFGYNKSDTSDSGSKNPNLRIISQNKRKSASSLEGGGQKGAGRVTLEAAANMSPAELQSLSADDWSYLRQQGF